jgi:N-6 DNA Methylase
MTAPLKRAGEKAFDSDDLTVGLRTTARAKYPLMDAIGLNSPIAQRIISKLGRLFDEHRSEVEPWFALWHEHCDYYFDVPAAEEILFPSVPVVSGRRLFLTHSYCKIVLSELVLLLSPGTEEGINRCGLYDWVGCVRDDELTNLCLELSGISRDTDNFFRFGVLQCSDLLAAVYQEILPPPLRHLLGEYYTPSWLVDYCIDHAERHRSPIGKVLTILDPAAGSGGFLAHYITKLGASQSMPATKIVGFDVNPLAVDFCHANVLLAISKTKARKVKISCEVSVHLADAVVDPSVDEAGPLFSDTTMGRKTILGVTFEQGPISASALKDVMRKFKGSAKAQTAFRKTLEQYLSDVFVPTQKVKADVVVGNPPWITWDGLTRNYRDKVAPQWASSTLVTNTGWKAKVAAGKTDFSSLFVYRSAQRHATDNAVMVFVLPLSLFQSRLAGAGFRTFRTSEGRTFAPVQIDDFSDVKVFPDAVNRTSVGTFVVNNAPTYPIQYRTWDEQKNGPLQSVAALAGPIDPSDITSPIIAFDRGCTELKTLVGKSDYRARGGVNTGGANTILWLEVLEEKGSICRVRNVGKSRRAESPVIEAEVERAAVHPLLCGPDMRRWKATPGKSILLLYSPDQPKKAMPVGAVKERFPRAFEFVSRFKTELEARKEYHRWGCSGPFYEVYRIGPYTFSPIKVVWQHTGYRKSLNVSVVDDRARQLVVPDQKAILIPFENLEEAHYACAFLSSSVTAELLDRYLGTDASTHILDYISLRKFNPSQLEHRKLAELSVSAHSLVAEGRSVTDVENEIASITSFLLRKS